MNIAELEDRFRAELRELYEPSECESLAWLSVNYICGYSRLEYNAQKHKKLSTGESLHLLAILEKLREGRPLQYILEETEFYGLRFRVSEAVLIPRPETEELVDWIMRDQRGRAGLRLLDIGTGSGCIAISLAKNMSGAEVFALDISADALQVARENAESNSADVAFIRSDILQADRWSDWVPGKFDLIVSNPPYVKENEKALMHQNVLDFEPHTALFVPDNDALLFYRHIVEFSVKYLDPAGSLYLEINEQLSDETLSMLAGKGFKSRELRKDLRSRDRMIRAKFE